MERDAWQENEARMYELRGRFIEAMCIVEDGIDVAIASRWCTPEDQDEFVSTFVAHRPQHQKKTVLAESLSAYGWTPTTSATSSPLPSGWSNGATGWLMVGTSRAGYCSTNMATNFHQRGFRSSETASMS